MAQDFSAADSTFLDSLLGTWRGKAVTTPTGPLPYDIEFMRQPDGSVTGVAKPGRALHHWKFARFNGHLSLHFLTTFRGNATPNRLHVESRTSRVISFRAERPAYLRVDIEPGENKIDIGIFLHEEPHVSIELKRIP